MIRQIAIIGTGTMGRGIAYLSAVAGYDTVIHDADAAALDAARGSVDSLLRKQTEKGKVTAEAAAAALERVHVAADLEPAVRQADLIIEAVPEDADLKKNIFSQADLFCGEETILASNTSSISISELASAVERRDRFVGMHFFNPPQAMKLIEIVRGERTADETIAEVRTVAEARATFAEAQRLHRTPRGIFIWGLLSLITSKRVREEQQKGLSGVVLLERGEKRTMLVEPCEHWKR